MNKDTPQKSKIYSNLEAAQAYAMNTLGLKGWDIHNDQEAFCYGSLSTSRTVAEIKPKGRGVKLTWEISAEKREPKMIGM